MPTMNLTMAFEHQDPAAEAADLAACRELLRNGSRSFLAASLLLPREVRDSACALYAFCRLADDAVDVDPGRGDPVARLRERLAAIYRAQPLPSAADRALARVVRRYAIPRAVPEALIDGFEWDVQGRRFESLEELQDYAARVAATVGVMMALLMGVRSPEGLARACDLGVAMQLSNIARDVGEDARMGRLYLPQAWLREAGIDPQDWLAAPNFSPALAAVVQRLLDAADRLYRRVDAGVAQLPLACRPGINAARFLYAEIGREVERRGLDSVSQRAVVPRARKLGLLFDALTTLQPARAAVDAPPLDCTLFLVEAVLATPRPAAGPAPERWSLHRRAIRIIDLIEQLEQRKQTRRSASLS
jgi:phytoene synthase